MGFANGHCSIDNMLQRISRQLNLSEPLLYFRTRCGCCGSQLMWTYKVTAERVTDCGFKVLRTERGSRSIKQCLQGRSCLMIIPLRKVFADIHIISVGTSGPSCP